eukprot:6175106-Alexandrium_andersonii.AAC.1
MTGNPASVGVSASSDRESGQPAQSVGSTGSSGVRPTPPTPPPPPGADSKLKYKKGVAQKAAQLAETSGGIHLPSMLHQLHGPGVRSFRTDPIPVGPNGKPNMTVYDAK